MTNPVSGGSSVPNVREQMTGKYVGDFSGAISGDIDGNITGDITGDISGDITGDVLQPGVLADASFVIGAEAGGNEITVSIQLKDAAGDDLATAAALLAFLSDNSSGLDVSADAPSGGVAAGTDGSIVKEHTAELAFWLQSEADGDIDLVITEAGADTWYLVLVMPNGSLVVSDAITFAA